MLLQRGDRGPAVADLRDALASLQMLPSLNGADRTQVEFDDTVDRAIRSFQQHRGLIVDGVVGPVTVRSMPGGRSATAFCPSRCPRR
jgi:N-acetylmuramoyl-L-alanine amidase